VVAVAARVSAAAIEVERKFEGDVGVEEIRRRVVRLGGREKGSVTFTDIYYDTPTCELTSRDVWLRRRDRGWELKAGRPHALTCARSLFVLTRHRSILSRGAGFIVQSFGFTVKGLEFRVRV
jgi:hypothetical protein